MHGPTLLEKRPASKHLAHGLRPSQFPERKHENRADSIRNRTTIENGCAPLPTRAGGCDLFLVDELIGKHEKGKCKRQYSTGPGPAILAADEKVGGEESADAEDRWRQNVSDSLRKQVMPT